MSFITDVFIVLIVFYLAYSYVVSPIKGVWMGLTGQDIPPPETYWQQICNCWEYFSPWNYLFIGFACSFFIASYKQQFADIVNGIAFAIGLISILTSNILACLPAAPPRALAAPTDTTTTDPSRALSAPTDTTTTDPPCARKSPARAQSPGPAKTWKVNSHVTAPYMETGNRFRATVKEEFNDGTYRIAWKDGDLTDTRKKSEDLRRSNWT